ncbi:MAG: PQQ-binding-like beta-propeller repeat protein [Verrucomicrobia bacterium]|nr:PQQ-binding-like beta-propeller repeat protein [Verrucomicrobiota bacterium]
MGNLAHWPNGVQWKRSGMMLLFSWAAIAAAADWPQYRGAAGDGVSAEPMAAAWATSDPGFVVWTNTTLTNGFSSFVAAQGRAFSLFSRHAGGSMREWCGALDARTGVELWATVIDGAPWNLNDIYNGGSGTPPYHKGDGPRGTPAVQGDRVFAFSGNEMHLVCMNATNGSVIWSNNLNAVYGASKLSWENAAAPRIEGGLIFVNLNTSFDNRNLAAFHTGDGTLAWSTQNERMTHTTPVVAAIDGVRQVIFATVTGLVSLNVTNGAFLWKFAYPFGSISTAMGASPLVHSNLVFCTAAYGRGATAAHVTRGGGAWAVTTNYYKTGSRNYRSVWMSPVCHEGFVYMLTGDSTSYLTTPLVCIELSTGTLRWATNGFGLGGLILVDTNLVVLTERGDLVRVQPDPQSYRELARHRVFEFGTNAPGKCWNSPAYSDGRLYARSTRAGVCVDVGPPPPLKFLSSRLRGDAQLELVVGTARGGPIAAERLSRIDVRATNTLGAPPGAWGRVTNSLVLTTNGVAVMTNRIDGGTSRQFYILSEEP